MKALVVTGILLIVLGVVALVFQGINYTDKETVIDLGPIEAQAEQEKTIPLSPILGIVAIAGGIVMVIYGSRKK